MTNWHVTLSLFEEDGFVAENFSTRKSRDFGHSATTPRWGMIVLSVTVSGPLCIHMGKKKSRPSPRVI